MNYPTTMEQIDFRKVKVIGKAPEGLLARMGHDVYARISDDDWVHFYTLSGPASKTASIPGLYQKLNK